MRAEDARCGAQIAETGMSGWSSSRLRIGFAAPAAAASLRAAGADASDAGVLLGTTRAGAPIGVFSVDTAATLRLGALAQRNPRRLGTEETPTLQREHRLATAAPRND